jgi:hypothetical protein
LLLLKAVSTDQYLTHYWPICTGQMFDKIGFADISQGNLTTFTSDRFGIENSALALNDGWAYVPTGIYFDSPEFTISLWIYPQTAGGWPRIIDFGNGPNGDNLVLTLADGPTLKPVLIMYAGSRQVLFESSTQALKLNQWQFLAVTFDGTFGKVYIHGNLVASSYNPFTMSSIQRTNCYIGRSNWPDGYSSSYLDDLRFYNKSLNQSEILQLMNQNVTTCKFLLLGL